MEANDNKIKYQFFDEQGKSHTVDQSEYDGRANDYARLYPKDQMRMVDKHGQSGLVPAGEVETAIKQGYRPFTISYSAPAPISNAPLNSVQPIGQTMENKAREEQAQLQKPIQQIQKTVDKEFNSQPATVNLGKGNVPVVPTPIQPQKPLKDIISDTDKEFNTSIAPKIDSFISQHKNAALKEMRSDDGLLSANQYVGAMAAKAQRYMSEIDAQNVLNDVRNYIGQKTGNGKGGNGVDPHTDRIMQRTIDYLAKKDMPKSSVEYILKNMIDGSLVGTIGNAVLGKSSTQQEVEQRGNELYNPSWVEKGVAGAGAMALDAPIFGGLGGISSKAFKLGTKALTKHVARQLAEKAGEKVISKATLEQAGRIVSQNTPKMIAQRIGMNAAESASTLGMYNTADDAINQAIQINNGSQEKYSLKQTAKSGLSGILMGGAFGVTDGAFAGVSRNMTGLKRIGTEIGGLASSAAVGTGVSTLEKYAQGEPVDIGEDYLTNIAMFGAMKLPHVGNVNLKSVDPKDREILKSTLAFTPEQKGELKNAGYDANHLVSTIAQLSANKKQKAATVEGQRNVSLIEDSNRDRELFGKEYAKIMQNPDISLSTKSKILYLVEGKLAIQPAITGYKTSTDEKGETILTTNDWAGRTIDKKAFKNNKDANTYIQKNNLLDNSIRNSVAFSEQLNDRAVEGVYKRQAIRDITTKYGISSDDISKIIADKAEGKELPENGDKMLDEIKWTVESDPEFIKRTSAAKAQDVKDMTGVNVDDALKKNKAERTEDEEKAISMYADKLQNGFRTEEESKDDNIDSIFDSNKQIENTKEPTGDNIQQHENENTTGNDAEEQILSNANKEGKILRVQTFGGDIVNVVDGHLEFDENGKVDLSKSDPEIYYKDQDGRTKVGSTEDTVSNLVDETDANELAAQAKQDAEDKQPIENSSEESPINTLVPIDKDQQNVGNEQENIQTQPQENTQSYLDRIPKDNEGNPLFEQTEPENTAGALLEMNDGDNIEAIDTAKQMSNNYESEIKKLEKKAPTGKSVIEIQNAKRQKKDALAELQNLYDYWDGVSSLLEQTPTNQTAEPQTSTAEVNDQEYKEETLTDKPKRSRGFYSKENDDMGAPNSLREAVIREIATGGYKFQWKDNENNKTKGLASHLGLKGDESERRGMIGFLSAPENGGLPPEVVAEKMRGDLGEMYPSATDQDIFNEILDVFHSYGGSRRSMWEEAKKLHGQTEEDDPEYKQYLEDIHQKIASSYHMTPEEYDLYNEYIPQKIEEENNTMTDNDYSDFLSTLAGQYNKEDNDSRRENIHGQLPEVETVQGNNGRSGPVLHGEENIHDEGYTNSEGSRQGGNAEPDKYNDNSLPDSKISGEPELTNKELEQEKDIFGKPSLDENKEVSLNQNNKNDGREIQQRTDEREPILQQIPQREHGEVPERNGGLEQTTGELERRCRIYEAELSGSGKTLSVEERKEIERRTTEDFAKENGLWIPMDKIFDLGVPGPSGNENDTYISGNDIYKVNSLMNSGSIVSLLNKTLLHNKIFPNTKYDFVGFTGFDKRSVFPVLKQRLILDAVPASPQEIKSYMRSLGFKETGEAIYSNGKIIISDLYPRNVLKSENGNIYVIDDEIKEADSSFVSPEKKRDESILNYADRIAAAKELHDEENKVVTNPTDAQKEAGNYKKGHVKIDGVDITIENPKGSVRSGTDANGNKWETEIHNTYGYIRGTKGVDGDHIDVYLSDDPTDGDVFVIDQIDPNTGEFDEHKVMYGFKSALAAKRAYLSNYEKDWNGLGNITRVSKEDFKKWIDSSHRKTKPFSEYSAIKTKNESNIDQRQYNSLSLNNQKTEGNDNSTTIRDSQNGSIKEPLGGIVAKSNGVLQSDRPLLNEPAVNNGNDATERKLSDKTSDRDGTNRELSPIGSDGSNQSRNVRDNQDGGQRSDRRGSQPIRDGKIGRGIAKTTPNLFGELQEDKPQLEKNSTEYQKSNPKNTRNYLLPSDAKDITGYSESTIAKDNIRAIEIIRDLLKEHRQATSSEREELGKFHGWGGLNIATAYSPYKMNAVQSGNFEKLENLCKEIDPDKKLNVRESIRRAALTSYYTPISLARTINHFIQKAGFKGGSLFDPSMGVGIFESTMSKSVQQNTSIHGVELDFLTGMISKHLFPDARIQVVGLQDAGISNNSNDVVVSNIPFGDIKVTDPSWKNNSNPIYRVAQLRIHNYFTVKMIDATKPGGLCVIVTSNAVLDTPNNRIVRQYIANNTEFLGAVRLPDNMFKSAGTKVVTDVLFLRKYKEGEIHTPPSFLELKDKDIDGTKLSYNEYYHIHPNNMIGNIVAGGQYRDDTFGLVSDLTTDEISAKVKKLSGKFINSEVIDTKKSERIVNKQLKESYKGNGNFERSGNIIIQDGKIGYLTTEKDDFGQSSLKFVQDTKLSSLGERAVSYIKLRNSLKELMYAELSEENDIARLRKNMNDNYSSFKDSFGRLGDKKNDFIANDIDGYTVRGLEQYKDGKFKGLADIFVKNTISPIRERMTATNPKEAINISLSEYGTIKESKMKHILGDNWEELCGDMIYHVPFSEDIQTKDEYLSGNVKYKLEDAERAAKTNNKFERNVEALKKVIPADIPASLISIRMGARWLPTDIYSQFAADDLGCTNSEVMYLEGIDDFKVKLQNTYNSKCDRFKTERKSVQDIFEAAIGDKTITVYDTEKSIGGSETKTLNKKETDAANEKVSELRSEFEEWITKDAKRADKIQRLYNDKFNCNVLRHYDGSHLEVPGLQGLSLRPHQKDAVWMILQNGGGIIDHIVGAGKTLVMQTAIMEMRRMGVANKPMIIALKSTVNQMVKEFHDAYPMANILAPTDKDFSKENRKKFLSNIALNEYDCIILSHEQYCQLNHTPEVESETLNEQMAQLDASLQYLYGAEQKSELSKRQIKGLEKRKASLEAKLKEINDRKVDKEFTFENLGIDYLFVDESHQFKNLQYFTSYQNVAGLGDPSGNKKTQALLNGIRYLQKLHQGDKGITFCSGTTITNSMVELYNLLNYLRPNEMRRLGLNTFDAWASNFADRSSELEFGVTNQLKAKNRFRRYINVPELSNMYAEIADVRNDNNLVLPKPKAREHMVAIEPNDEMENVNSEIIDMVNSKNGSFFNITPEDSNKAPWSLHATRLSAMNAIDPRLIDESYSDSPSSKISKAASNIADIYHKFDKQKGIQLVFTDLGTPNKNKFNVYDELIRKLVEDFEINRNEIAKIHDYDTEQKRKELFAKAKDGEIRVIIGGTKKLGTGVNVQDRVVAIHHIDVPWTPSSLDQRNGRGVRQGNIVARDFNDNNVDIYYYATERSLDAYKYQLLQTKKSFIDQVKDNTVGDREIDEGDGDEDNGFSYAAVVSVLSGNPIIFEKAKIDKKVDELRRKKRIYDEDLSRRIYNYNDAKQSYEVIQEFKKANEKDIEKLKANGFVPDSKGTYPSAISIYHNGKVYSNFERPKDAGKKLLDLISKSGTITIESYGFKAKIDRPTIKDGIFGKYTLVITGEGGIPYQQEISDDPTYAGVSMRSLLIRIINSNDKYNKELSRLSGMLEGGKPEQVPFKKQAELDEVIKKQVELAKELEKLSNPDQNERFRIRETQMQTRISDNTPKISKPVEKNNKLEELNTKFNEELQKQIDGTLKEDHIYQLGTPSKILLQSGIPNMPIELRAARLVKKSIQKNHLFDLNDIKNLPYAIQNPIMIFGSKTDPLSKVILTELSNGANNYIAAIKAQNKFVVGRKILEINEVRSIYPKDNDNITNWILRDNLLRWVDKDKAINWLGIRQSNSADDAIPNNSFTTANIIKNFKNPTLQDGKIMSEAEELAKTLNTEVHFTNSEDIKGGDEYSIKKRNAKGWYDTKTDEVYINPQNNIDEEDVKQTILHEVVAHKGLRKLLGDSFDDTMNDIFRSLPESERKEISGIFLNSKSWNTAEAAEEYCAHLAESGIDKPSIWKTIISKIRELLRKAGIKIKMSDNDIKYLLWKSRRHLENTPDNYGKEFKVKDNIYKDDFVDNRKATPLFRLDPQKLSEKDFNDIIGITKEVAMLNEEEQNDFIKRMEHQVLFESWIDKMNPIRVFQETVAKKYETEIPDECNAHLSYQTMTSRARYEKDTFKSIVFDKMLSAVNKVGKYDDVINYLIAKHGLERNVYMRKQKIEEAIEPLKEQITQIDYLLSRHSISEEEADAQRKSLENKIKKVATKITENFANEDFAGLTQLQKELQDDDSDLKDIKLNEPYIQHFVDEFEKSHDKDDIYDMWENIHEATNFCLETQRLYGCISKERMEQIKAMYNYYVPLRDWADPQAEDFFTYFYKDRHDLNIPIQKAKGRKTKAGDPIANIGSMADSAIVLGNKNRVKQHLYRLVFNYPTNLAHVSPVWVAWNPNTLTYEEVAFEGIDSKGNPLDGENYDTAFEEWNNRMKSLAKQNIVVQKNEKLSIGVPIKAWQAKQHQVRLTINGKDYIISMDSSPRVAQSINGDNIDEGMQAFQKLKNATNWMARNFTSKMINFVFRNFFRDYTGAITYNSIYGYSSMKDFLAATPKASKVLAEYLTTKKMPEGKYGGYLEEFLKNGGETGYTNSMSYKDYFKEIQNEISKVKHPTKLHLFRWIGNAMEILNRGAEDTTRLSAYIASRESGKSIMQSINAAKEISVNFNRMGSGRNGNSFIRAWEMFFNAGLQAVYNTVRGFKYHPVKSTIAFGTWTLIGAMKGILQSIYGDDKYYQLPDWIRQNNFTISVGGDLLLNIPLALEIRPFFAMGDILAQVVLGKYHDKNAVTDIATKFMEAAPYNFMEGSNSKGDTFEQILANTLAPSAVKPLIDVYWTNKDYTGRPISKRNEFNEYVPEYKKGYRSTSDLAIAISKGINDLSGGDMAKKGALDSELTNPAVMEYLFNNYGGGVLKQIYGVAKSGYNLVTPGKDVDVRDIPAVSALLYKFDNSKGNSNVNERYYRYLDEYEENQSQDREYTKSIMSSEKGAVEHYFNKKANLENEKDMQIIGMYKKIIETIQQKAKSIPDGNESDQLQKQIYGLKKAMVEQLEK